MAISTACVATSRAASVAALAVDTSASEAVSARIEGVRSGVNSHAEAAADSDVEDGVDCDLLLFGLRYAVLRGIDSLRSVCAAYVPCDACDVWGDWLNALLHSGDINAHSTAIVVILVVLEAVIDVNGDVQHSVANDGRCLFLLREAPSTL